MQLLAIRLRTTTHARVSDAAESEEAKEGEDPPPPQEPQEEENIIQQLRLDYRPRFFHDRLDGDEYNKHDEAADKLLAAECDTGSDDEDGLAFLDSARTRAERDKEVDEALVVDDDDCDDDDDEKQQQHYNYHDALSILMLLHMNHKSIPEE